MERIKDILPGGDSGGGGEAERYIIVKTTELPEDQKYHGASHDSEYETISTEDGIGVAMGAMPLEPGEVEEIRNLPQVAEIFPDRTRSIPEPIDAHTAVHVESEQDAFRFHELTDELNHSRFRGAGGIVAVLDTGIDQAHSRNQFDMIAAKNFTSDSDAWDYQGHGTWCAGAVCSDRYGFANEAKLLSGKVLNNQGSGRDSWIIAGINWALQQGAQVASLSLGGTGEKNDPLSLAVNNAYLKGMNCVCAAGNDQRGTTARTADYHSPGNAAYATTVAACDINGQLAVFSSWGYCVDIMALGVNAEGLGLGGNFGRRMSGTSMATPYTAGGMIIGRAQGRSAAGAKKKLYEWARDTNYGSIKEGHGIMRIREAV